MDDDENKKWPKAVEKHFIDILLEEDAKGNMPQGQFKPGTWTAVMNEFNKHANKNYSKTQTYTKISTNETETPHILPAHRMYRNGMGPHFKYSDGQ